MTLIKMSAAGAVMIAMTVVLRAFMIHKFPKKVFLLLWGVVFLRLALPFSVPWDYSVYSLLGNGGMQWQRPEAEMETGERLPEIMVPRPAEVLGTAGTEQKQGMQGSVGNLSGWEIIWLSGMVLCALFFSMAYLYWYKKFRTSIPADNEFVAGWLKSHRRKRPVQVRQSDRISAPLTYGILRPVILLPKGIGWENERQLECVLLHEYVHICHYDMILKLGAAAVLCVHWFNPLVWLAYVLFSRDIELACDESVVRRLGESAKAVYAGTLIWMEEKKSGLIPVGNHFSENATEERITAIMRSKKATIGTLVASGAVLAAVAVFFATSPEGHGGQAGGSGGNGGLSFAGTSDFGKEENRSASGGAGLGEQEGQPASGVAGFGEQEGQPASGGAGFGEQEGQPASDGAGFGDGESLSGRDGRMLFCMGKVYLSTGEDVSEMVAAEAAGAEYDSPYIGEIDSTVNEADVPGQELQSNFGYMGSEVIFNGSGIAVDMDGRWIQFYPIGDDVPDSTVFENLVTRLEVSIVYANGSFSFTIPESGSHWHILINGRAEAEKFGGMSSHFLQELSESNTWKGGETYSFPVDAEALKELYMEVSIGEESTVIDLMEYLPENTIAA